MSGKTIFILLVGLALLGAGSWLGYSMAKTSMTPPGEPGLTTPASTGVAGPAGEPGVQPVGPAGQPQARPASGNVPRRTPQTQPGRIVPRQSRPAPPPPAVSEEEHQKFAAEATARFEDTEWNIGGEEFRFGKEGVLSIGGKPTGSWKPADGQIHYTVGNELHSVQVYEGQLVSDDGTPLHEVRREAEPDRSGEKSGEKSGGESGGESGEESGGEREEQK